MRHRIPRDLRWMAWGALLLALGVREAWVFLVQSPFDTIYSDMGAYVDRAREISEGVDRVYPRFRAFYPYGTHYLLGAEFWALGFDRQNVIRAVQAAMTAAPAYHFFLLCSRFFKRRLVLAGFAVAFAFWQPIVWFAGFFISEVPFVFLLFYNAWLMVRFAETREAGLRLGLTSAILFTVRPQYILTFALLVVLYVLERGRAVLKRRDLGAYARVLAPWALVLGFSAARMRVLTGHLGLISENGSLNRVFSDTTIGRVEANWLSARGDSWWYWFEPPTKQLVNERETVKIAGYIGDPQLLGDLRREFVAKKSFTWRVSRAVRNVELLARWNDPWPEEDRVGTSWRRDLQRRFNEVVRNLLLPLGALGILFAPRRAPLAILFAHLVTLVILAAFFFPESRYRCPYDPMILILATIGAWRVFLGGRWAVRRAVTHLVAVVRARRGS